jgi:hypothetical protein
MRKEDEKGKPGHSQRRGAQLADAAASTFIAYALPSRGTVGQSLGTGHVCFGVVIRAHGASPTSSLSTMPVDTLRPGFYANGSVEVEPASPGQSAVRRLDITKDKLVSQPADGVDTVYDLLQYAARTHGSRNALGWRDIIKVHEVEKEVTKTVDGKAVVEKKTWKYFELSDYHYHSFVDVQRIVSEIARGFVELGIKSHEVFNVYAQTRCVDFNSFKKTRQGNPYWFLAQAGNSLRMLARPCLYQLQLLMIALGRTVLSTLWKSPNQWVYSRTTTFSLSLPASCLTRLL